MKKFPTLPVVSALLGLTVTACSNGQAVQPGFGYAGPFPAQSGHYGSPLQAPCPPQSCGAYPVQQAGGYYAPQYQGYSALNTRYGAQDYGQAGAYYGQNLDASGSRGGIAQPYSYGPMSAMAGRGNALTYESLNRLEAPVATEIAGVTFELRGRLDSVTDYSLEQDDANPDHRLVGSHLITATKQLPNRYTVGAIFTGRHMDIGNSDVDYRGRIRGFVGGSWGTLLGGNVQDIVYESTRRLRGAGVNIGDGPRETNLRGDGALGRLSDWGGGYQGRFGPTVISAIVDEDANYDVGVRFQRPIGNKDYRFTARHNTGSFVAADGLTEFDTRAVSGVGEYVYGSTRYDLGVGYEQLETGAIEADRWFTSAGVTTKRGVLSLTAEGHYGEVEGESEISAFVGAKYDLARGLSATAGLEYEDQQINLNGVDFVNTKDTRAVLGLSYGF